jgi:K+-sensing histidine kinase KdpD
VRLRGPQRSEWIVTALVMFMCALSSWQLHEQVREVDAASDRRRAQLSRLAELSNASEVATDGVHAVEGLFARHQVVVEQTPWGSLLALRPEPRGGDR